MKRALAVTLAAAFLVLATAPAEAKHRGRWDNCNGFGRGCDNNGFGVRRTVSRFLFGPGFRQDNGRHLGWYKNGKRAPRSWWW